jgi:hypothetical protein
VANVAHNLITRNPPGHIRYQYGGDDPYDSPDPRVLDCSSLVDWVYYHAVGRPIVPGGRSVTGSLLGWRQHTLPADLATQVKGVMLHRPGHVEVSLGNGTSVGANTDEVPLPEQVNIGPATGFDSGGTMPGVNYGDAATNPDAAARLSAIVGYPVTVSDPNEFGAPANVAGAGGGAASGADAFNQFVNVYGWGFAPSGMGDVLSGARAMMNDTPLLPYLGQLLSSTFRSYCSAPNGDFMAWFPDYFGLFGSAAKMNVLSIELQDFTVEWVDQHIVTHQYVVGVPHGYFDPNTAQLSAGGTNNNYAWETITGGIATMDFPDIFKPIFGGPASQEFIDTYLKRFGGRPDVQQIPSIQQGSLMEFFMALFLFMQRWAAQFQANVPMTFMPELWPGMLLALPEYSFQAYISEVQHQFKFGPGGGFQTTASICAPAKTDQADSIFGLLPIGGEAGQQLMEDAGAMPGNVGRPGGTPQRPS